MHDRLALVTGSTGFIGSQLTRRLINDGWRVRVALRTCSRVERLSNLACERAVIDLDSADSPPADELLAGVTHIFHVAGLVAGTPAELDLANRRATEVLARHAARLNTPPVFLLVSSAAAAGPSDGIDPRSPSFPPAPISSYGRSKLAGEMAAIAHAPPLPLTIVRPGIVFGEGDREFVNIFRAMVRFRINPMIGRGRQPLSMIDVEDLCGLLILAAEQGERVGEKDARGLPREGRGIYNAANPQPLSLLEVGQAVRQELGNRRIFNLHLPPRAGYVVGGVSEFACRWTGRKMTLNRDKITEARAAGWALDVTKTTSHLGWTPRQDIQSQVRDACRQAIDQGLC